MSMLKFTAAAVLVALGSTAVAQTRSAVKGPDLGQPVSAEDLAKWDIEIPPSGKGLPAGSGTVAAGEAVYAKSCQSCHGPKGAGKPNDALVGGVGNLAGKGPALKTVGSYWPYATTVFDYIKRAMPFAAPGSMSDDDVYAVTAYLLSANAIIPDTTTLNAAVLRAVRMPARDHFVPDNRKPTATAK